MSVTGRYKIVLHLEVILLGLCPVQQLQAQQHISIHEDPPNRDLTTLTLLRVRSMRWES